MTDTSSTTAPNPWPTIHRIVFRADAIGKTKTIPYAAVIYQRQIHIIPRSAIGVGCEVLWTWTLTELRKGLTFAAMAELEARLAAALQSRVDDPPEIRCPYDTQLDTLNPEDLIV